MLELKNISYFYKSQKDKMVLDQISYQFEKGKMYAILGASGSGKTTLLSLLAGLDSPISGEIDMNGENIEEKGLANHRKNHISLVFQNYNLIDYLTPVENVKLGGNADAEMLLTQMGIDKSTRKRNVMQLSGGQQQRVWLAMALAQKTPILLLDEPTTYLDVKYQIEILNLIKEINKKYQMTIIMVHHDINQAINYSDEIIAMKDGKILFQGVPEEVITSASLKSLYDYDLSVIDYNHQKIVLNYQ